MINIQLESLGKRHQNQWIFRGINYDFSSHDKVSIIGYNGSGKSTLIQIISGFQAPTEGKINFKLNNALIDPNLRYKYLSIGTPYIDLPEELSISEFIDVFTYFKPFNSNISNSDFQEIAQLSSAGNKPIKNFSSGMKQRIKLAFAILSQAPILLLDEPLTNLDESGIKWYLDLINQYATNKIVFVASNNIKDEISFCTKTIDINRFKI